MDFLLRPLLLEDFSQVQLANFFFGQSTKSLEFSDTSEILDLTQCEKSNSKAAQKTQTSTQAKTWNGYNFLSFFLHECVYFSPCASIALAEKNNVFVWTALRQVRIYDFRRKYWALSSKSFTGTLSFDKSPKSRKGSLIPRLLKVFKKINWLISLIRKSQVSCHPCPNVSEKLLFFSSSRGVQNAKNH